MDILKIIFSTLIILFGSYVLKSVESTLLLIFIVFSKYAFAIYILSGFNFEKLKITPTLKKQKAPFFLLISFLAILLINLFLEYLMTFLILEEKMDLKTYNFSSWNVIIILLSPILEEVYFRRYLAYKLFYSFGFKKSVIYTSLLFSIIHIFSDDAGIITTFIGSLVLTALYLRTSNLYYCIAIHYMNNITFFFIGHTNFYKIITPTFATFGLVLGLICLITIFLNYFNDERKKQKQEKV